MELKNNKSAWAALATLGVTAVAAGTTAIVKLRKKRRQQREQESHESNKRLTAEQMMVYNEAVSVFKELNERIYELRRQRKELQPLIKWLATDGEKPKTGDGDDTLAKLAADIERFLIMQVPFINACLVTAGENDMTYIDCVRGDVDGMFDSTLDEEPTGLDVEEGTRIKFVLKLGYFFPDATISPYPVKSIVLV